MIGNERISVRIPKNLINDMDKKIKQKECNRSDFVRMAISEYMYGSWAKE